MKEVGMKSRRQRVTVRNSWHPQKKWMKTYGVERWVQGLANDPEMQGASGCTAYAIATAFGFVAAEKRGLTITWTDQAIADAIGCHVNTVANLHHLWLRKGCVVRTEVGGKKLLDKETGVITRTPSTYRIHTHEVPLLIDVPGSASVEDGDCDPRMPIWRGRHIHWRLWLALRHEAHTITELSAKVGLHRNTVTKALRDLEAESLVERFQVDRNENAYIQSRIGIYTNKEEAS